MEGDLGSFFFFVLRREAALANIEKAETMHLDKQAR